MVPRLDDRMLADMQSDGEDSPAELYSDDGDVPLYDGNVAGFDDYHQAVQAYAAATGGNGYGASQPTAPAPSPKQYSNTAQMYGGKAAAYDANRDMFVPAREYSADGLVPADTEIERLLEEYDEEIEERMAQYGLDPGDGWAPLLESEAYDEDVDAFLADVETRFEDAYGEAGDQQEYVTAIDETLDAPDLELYSRYLEDEDDGKPYLEIAVVEQEMPDGLFGFTRPGREKIAFVNKALYDVDKERTKLHEITHQENPHWSEFMVRSRRTRGGGDIDPRYTLSFQANNAGRIGNGQGRIRPYDIDEFGVYGPQDAGYSEA